MALLGPVYLLWCPSLVSYLILMFLSSLEMHYLDNFMKCTLMCSWQVLISMPAGEQLEIPYSLKATEETPLDQVCS